MVTLMTVTFVLVYFVTGPIRNLLFLPILILAFRSKNDVLWIAYLFLLINAPAFFFGRSSADAAFRLPLYQLASGFSLAISDLLLFILIYKSYNRWFKEKKLEVASNIKYIGIYFLIVSLPFTFTLGATLADFVNKLRFISFYAMVPIFFTLVNTKEKIYRFAYLIIPFITIILIDQLHVVARSVHLVEYFDPGARSVAANSQTGGIRPIPGGDLIILFAMIMSLFIEKEYHLFRGFKDIVFSIGILSFFISATRALLAMGIILFLVNAFLSKNSVKNVVTVIAGAIVVLQLLVFTGLMDPEIVNASLKRFELFAKLFQQDSNPYMNTGLDTYDHRLEVEVPKVMHGISYSPVFGVGLSKYFSKYYNSDLGFHNTILFFGYVGFILFLSIIASIFLNLNHFRKKVSSPHVKNQLHVMIAAWAAIMTGYAFTWDFFNFYPSKVMFVSLLLVIPDLTLLSGSSENKDVNA